MIRLTILTVKPFSCEDLKGKASGHLEQLKQQTSGHFEDGRFISSVVVLKSVARAHAGPSGEDVRLEESAGSSDFHMDFIGSLFCVEVRLRQ